MAKNNEQHSELFMLLEESMKSCIDGLKTGNIRRQKRHLDIEPVKHYSPAEIKQVRVNANMTQSVFANLMGVTKKTIEAWERGTNKPSGPARRLFALIENKELPQLKEA